MQKETLLNSEFFNSTFLLTSSELLFCCFAHGLRFDSEWLFTLGVAERLEAVVTVSIQQNNWYKALKGYNLVQQMAYNFIIIIIYYQEQHHSLSKDYDEISCDREHSTMTTRAANWGQLNSLSTNKKVYYNSFLPWTIRDMRGKQLCNKPKQCHTVAKAKNNLTPKRFQDKLYKSATYSEVN